MGAKKYTCLETLVNVPHQTHACIVEIGSERGEGSTTFFVNFAKKHGVAFYTVDFDPEQYNHAAAICARAGSDNIQAFNMTGEAFLKDVFPSFNKPIFFLYLDNFDFIYDHIVGLVDNQVAAYRALGVTMNNTNSKIAHLQQTELAEPHMDENGIILCDDTFRRGDAWDGKCASAVPFLLYKGWRILDSDPGTRHHDHGFVLLQKTRGI